jgi:hypothetical protein
MGLVLVDEASNPALAELSLGYKQRDFFIVSLVGGRPLFVSPLMYCTSSKRTRDNSYCTWLDSYAELSHAASHGSTEIGQPAHHGKVYPR